MKALNNKSGNMLVFAFQLFSNIIDVTADYGCLCIRGGTSDVHLQPFVLSPVLGQLKNGDCKPTYPAGTSVKWTAIQYHNQVGFITNTSIVNFYNCQGHPLDKDAYPTPASKIQTTSTPALNHMTPATTTTTNATQSTTTIPSESSIGFANTSTTQTTFQTTTKMNAQCPPQVKSHHRHYIEALGRCYEFIKTPHTNWYDAEHDCNSRGGHLVSITSLAEQTLISTELWRQRFNEDDTHVWIGLTDKDKEGDWKWSSGERLTFTYWAKGESHGNFEDCALLAMDKIGHWMDVPCSGQLRRRRRFLIFNKQRHGHVCEYHLV